MTRQEVCDLIRLKLAGDIPSQDFRPFVDEINYWLDFGLAEAIKRNYISGVTVDGVEFVGDAFMVTVKDIVLSQEPVTGYFVGAMPSMPISLPRGYDISSLYLETPVGKLTRPGVRVSPQQLDYYKGLPMPPSSFFYWFEGDKVYVESFVDITGFKIRARMAGGVDKSLTAKFPCPDDYMPIVLEYVINQFIRPVPKDESNDGKNIL